MNQSVTDKEINKGKYESNLHTRDLSDLMAYISLSSHIALSLGKDNVRRNLSTCAENPHLPRLRENMGPEKKRDVMITVTEPAGGRISVRN